MIQRLLDVFFNIVFSFFPLRKSVLFSNLLDNYNDNPKYISEYLYKIDPSITQVWCYSAEKAYNPYPDYIKLVKRPSISFWYWKNVSKILVDNSVGFQTTSKYFLKSFLKRNGQINISTWHGTPLKKLGKDNNADRLPETFFTSSNYMILGSEYEKKIFGNAYNHALNILLLGNPRNDVLFKMKDESIKQELNISEDKKVVLFAPTYRDNHREKGYLEIIDTESIYGITNELSKKFGGDWVLAFRLHHNDEDLICEMKKKLGDIVVDANRIPDMNKLLAVSDMLITDYSGSLFDYMHLKRPCVLFAPDLELYSSDRGLYLTMDELPWPVASSVKELIALIESYDTNCVNANVEQFLKLSGNKNDGLATKRVCDIIVAEIAK